MRNWKKSKSRKGGRPEYSNEPGQILLDPPDCELYISFSLPPFPVNGTADNTVFEKNEKREGMAKRVGMSRDNGRGRKGWTLTAAVTNIFEFVRLAEFEILFILFLIIAFIIFKDLTSRPEYNQLLVKKPGGVDWWPY
ncbi:hypothetical protein Gohar_013214 [Gossypium harknessii]|uniref:Uncharacterized protein n=1 Tax=Gossypium harknessii TaxID=34285 RepID=A0A7J9GZL7_9ROSI|nr:hypothetical protein [Gossypium harknessii]